MKKSLISLETVVEVNKRNGGTELNTRSVDFALNQGAGKSVFRQLALLWRAILVDHGFTDANERTALDVATILLSRAGYVITNERRVRLTKQVLKATKKTLNNALRIEYRLRYAVNGGG